MSGPEAECRACHSPGAASTGLGFLRGSAPPGNKSKPRKVFPRRSTS